MILELLKLFRETTTKVAPDNTTVIKIRLNCRLSYTLIYFNILVVIKDYESAFDAVALIQIP